MQNVSHKVVGTKLVIEVDLTQSLGPSSSGKTIMIGSTEGNVKVEGWKARAVSFGLNVFTKDGLK